MATFLRIVADCAAAREWAYQVGSSAPASWCVVRLGVMVRLSRQEAHRPCSPPRIALSVPARRAFWSAIRSASSAGARSRGVAAPYLAACCPLDVFLEATFHRTFDV